MNECASKIQKSYKNYRSFQINKRIDFLHAPHFFLPDDETYENEVNEEIEYWENMRNRIKNKKRYLQTSISDDWINV